MKKIFLILAYCLMISSEAFCFNIRTDAHRIRLKIVPNENPRGTINVENPTQDEINVRAYLEDFSYAEPFDGAKKFSPPGSTKESCANWITFSPQEFTLRPFAKKKVNYSISVPENASGGYYAVLFFETALGAVNNQDDGTNILIKGRLGSLFLLETEDRIKKAEIENITAEGKSITGFLTDKGNTFLTAKGSYYIMNAKGDVLDREQIKDIYISPENKAQFSIGPGKKIIPGSYTLMLTFDLDEGDILVREIDFSLNSFGKMEILEIRE